MRPSEILAEKRDEVLAVIAQSRFTNSRLFGSVARGEDTETSDIDMLVDPLQGASLFDLGRLEVELVDLLGCSVDIATPRALAGRVAERVADDLRPL